MKSIRRVLVVAGSVASLHFGVAQQIVTAAQSAQAFSVDDLQIMIQAVESTKPLPASASPKFGNFYSAQLGEKYPPLPFDPMNLPFWPLGGGFYIYDDRNVDYSALKPQAEPKVSLSAGSNSRLSMMASIVVIGRSPSNNPVNLTNFVATNDGSAMNVSFSIAGGTNFVPSDVLTSTNAADPVLSWSWLGLGYTSNSYTFSNQPLNQAFYVLAKPQKTMVVGWGADGTGQCDARAGLTNAAMVAGGYGQSLALLNDGTVMAWGENAYGEGSVPTNLSVVAMVACGWYHDVALLTNGTVTAWGLNGASLGYNLTEVPPGLSNVTAISAQALHSLALMSNGAVVAWGYGEDGEAGVPSGLANVVAIAAGFQFNLAAMSDGTVTAWGDNTYGQIDIPPGLSGVVRVAAGLYHGLALLNNGTVVAWGDNSDGETNVPADLTNVVAIAAGGDPLEDTAYSLALKSDGTVVAWGNAQTVTAMQGMSNVFAIGAGANHALAIRTGPRTPVITLEPVDQYQLPGGNVTFTTRGSGLYGVAYQWQNNGVNLTGATNATLTVTNVQATAQGAYQAVISDASGSLVSSNAGSVIVTPPVITSLTLPTNQVGIFQSNLTLSVTATAPGQSNSFPIHYQWQFAGTNIPGATSASYAFKLTADSAGTYSVLVSNAAGGTNAAWQVAVIAPTGLIIAQQPADQYQLGGGEVTFVAGAVSTNVVTYQWQFEGTNIDGATNDTLTLTNMQAAQQGYYDVVASDSVNILASSNAYFYLVTPPAITSLTPPADPAGIYQSGLILSVTATAPGETNGFPIGYQWQFDGTNITGATSASYTAFMNTSSPGTYSVIVANAAGSSEANWQVTLTYAGSYIGVGTLAYHLSTNAIGYASGYTGSAGDETEVSNWYYTNYTTTNMALLTNAVWSTNFWLHGVQGLSATAIGYSNGFGGQTLLTMVSPRHYLRAHHVGPPGGVVVFLDTNNVVYFRNYVQQVQVGTSDTDVGILDSDLPASVGFLPIVPTNLSNYLPTNSISIVQGIGMDQAMRVFGQPMTFGAPPLVTWNSRSSAPFGLGTNWNVTIIGGDSSDPEMLLIGNQLVLVSHNFQSAGGPNYALEFDGINQQMHYLSTNNSVGTDYQLTPFSLTNWTVINP